MFKKHFVILIYLTAVLLGGKVAKAEEVKKHTIPEADIKKYTALNDAESRLSEYRDDESALMLKLNQLAHINASRKKHHQKTVELDILTSRVANKISQEAATNNFMGHFNLRGESPYYRYALADGVDHVTENASALSSTGSLPSAPEDISGYMQQAHNAFMAERAPNDGHKQNCIAPHHNFIGIGFYLDGKQFRYYEEFLDRYLVFGEFKKSVSTNTKISIPVKPINGKHLHMVAAYYQKFPSKMNAETINKQMQYNDFTDDLAHRISPWELPQPNEQGFTELEFTFAKKGLYYIQIFLDDKPFTTGKASTKNKIQASGVVIEVK